jgi:BirA family biotin operon repressor/biotin-[acetyl-CoA-carboxylase] ligase
MVRTPESNPGLTRDPQDVRSTLREHLCAVAQTLQQDGFGPIRGRWLARAHGLGLPVRAVIGQETIVGVAIDLSEDGALRVETPDGRNRSISAGEVYFTQQTSPG